MQEHRQQLMQLRSLADADVAALLAAVSGESVADVRNALIDVLPELMAPYLTASGELAAVLFEDLRVEAGVRGTFYAESAAPALTAARVDGTARWAVAPLADDALSATVQSRLAGSMMRAIMDSSRDTMQANGARQGTRFQRMARPGACAFCGILASRPPWMSYRSSESAGGVVGRGSDRTGLDAAGNRLSGGVGGGVHARGKANLGDAYHDDCRCVVMPIYGGTEMANLAKVEREAWEQKYAEAIPGDDNPLNARNMKDMAANWRKVHGSN